MTQAGGFPARAARRATRAAWRGSTTPIGAMPPDRIAAAFGAAPIEAQIEQARAFYGAFRSADSNWKLEEHPFLRGTTDPWIVSSQIALADGAVAPPAGAVVLGRAVRSIRDHAAHRRRRCEREPRVAGHARVARAEDCRQRSRRSGAIATRWCASRRRVFRNVEGDRAVDALVALGGYRRYRAILLALDRMEITDAARLRAHRRSGAPAGRRAVGPRRASTRHRVSSVAGDPRTRAADAGRSTSPTAERLVLSLADVDRSAHGRQARRRMFTAITQWMVTTLLDALPPLVQPDQWTTAKTAYESRLLQALAGPPSDPDAPTLKWEGLDYRVDLFRRGARAPQAHPRADRLAGPRCGARRQRRREDRRALLALIYTPALGDPEGPALLGGDIAQRHNFGLVGPGRHAPRLRGVGAAARTGRRRHRRGTSKARSSASTSRSRVWRCAASPTTRCRWRRRST